ncbi:MAG TPA: recombinase family protein [Acetobacteraceae bacterium]|nr:recombinase family protein [Acetobacteraceae bacterium]
MAKSEPIVSRRGGAIVRCAVYTRKSSEEGLEQDFNSLHAQREACEAYVKSQKHEGWVVLPGQYDDGGISGATMERPALQQLLADIRTRKVDTVVVYKVDRLTRSLADFAKIVEIFDAHDVAFVSVTQHFNTTTSMGRLTLNVLSSFAQFEREVAGERIRDKIAASKQRGMWMGGNLPLGYDVRDRKLVVNEAEAEAVRHIFRRYAALRSVRLLAEDLVDAGITSKQWLSTTGQQWGGKRLARGALYLMLQNRIYLGEIVHKDRHYPGQHAPIVDRTLWDQVQEYFAANAGDRRAGRAAKQPSLLAGLIFDSLGQRMSPTHAVKAGKRYRYYISRPLVTGARAKAPGAYRIPAPEVEQVVTDRVRTLLADGTAVFDAVSSTTATTEQCGELVAQAAALAQSWPTLPLHEQRRILSTLIARIEVGDDSVALHVAPAKLGTILQGDDVGDRHFDRDGGRGAEILILSVAAQLQRVGKGSRLIVGAGTRGTASPNASLIRLLARAHQLQQQLLHKRKRDAQELAQQADPNRTYTAQLLRLSWLAPDIIQAILQGHQPPTLTADKLSRATRIPLDWPTQRAALGFH